MNFKSLSRILVNIAAVALVVPTVWSQNAGKTGPKYDLTKEAKVSGTVEQVRETPGEWEGIHLVVKSGDRTVIVQLAPAEFLKELDCWIKVGDDVEVVGSKAPDTTEDEVLAREVTFGNNTMVLRDQKGIPVWAGWKPQKDSGK
jgi:hypothetical protein